MSAVVRALEMEWCQLLTTTRARSAVKRWSDDPALWGFEDLDAMVEYVNQRGHQASTDRVLAALVVRASVDDIAARTVLQAVLPGLKAIIRTYSRPGTHEDVASAVVAVAFERIRTYPMQRRPEHVAANILLDTRQRVYRRIMRDLAAEATFGRRVELDELRRVPSRPSRSSTDELLDVVAEARREGAISREGACLILLTRVADRSAEEVAERCGVDVRTVRQRRRRAELALGEWAAAGAVA